MAPFLTGSKVSSTARLAHKVVSSVPARTHAITFLPLRYSRPHFIDHPHHLVPRHTRIQNSRPNSIFCQMVAVTNPTGLYPHSHPSQTRLADLPLLNFKIPARPPSSRCLPLHPLSSPR